MKIMYSKVFFEVWVSFLNTEKFSSNLLKIFSSVAPPALRSLRVLFGVFQQLINSLPLSVCLPKIGTGATTDINKEPVCEIQRTNSF
jgi:hypothetical protein